MKGTDALGLEHCQNEVFIRFDPFALRRGLAFHSCAAWIEIELAFGLVTVEARYAVEPFHC